MSTQNPTHCHRTLPRYLTGFQDIENNVKPQRLSSQATSTSKPPDGNVDLLLMHWNVERSKGSNIITWKRPFNTFSGWFNLSICQIPIWRPFRVSWSSLLFIDQLSKCPSPTRSSCPLLLLVASCLSNVTVEKQESLPAISIDKKHPGGALSHSTSRC